MSVKNGWMETDVLALQKNVPSKPNIYFQGIIPEGKDLSVGGVNELGLHNAHETEVMFTYKRAYMWQQK